MPLSIPLDLKTEAAFARGISERFDAPVEPIAAAVEYNILDAGLYRTLSDNLAHSSSRIFVRARFECTLNVFVQRRRRRYRLAGRIVDHLRVDVLR